MKVAFFDRDGTIIRDYPDENWTDVIEPEWIPGAVATMKEVQKAGYKIIIVTNQYLIGEGLIKEDRYYSIANQFEAGLRKAGIVPIGIYVCPHSRDSGCVCCKPNPGLINQAFRDFPEIDIKNSFMIGDSISDMELAAHFKMSSFYLGDQNFSDGRIQSLRSISELPEKISR